MFFAQEGTIQTITLLRIWVTHGVPGTPMKNCLGAVFKYGFNKASNYLGNLAFSRL